MIKVNDDFKKDILDTFDFIDFINNFDCQTKVTKAGDVKFKVEYDDKNIKYINCEFYISPDKIDLSKTKTSNRNDNKKEMSQVKLNVLPTSINPHFLLKLFDKYHNLK